MYVLDESASRLGVHQRDNLKGQYYPFTHQSIAANLNFHLQRLGNTVIVLNMMKMPLREAAGLFLYSTCLAIKSHPRGGIRVLFMPAGQTARSTEDAAAVLPC